MFLAEDILLELIRTQILLVQVVVHLNRLVLQVFFLFLEVFARNILHLNRLFVHQH